MLINKKALTIPDRGQNYFHCRSLSFLEKVRSSGMNRISEYSDYDRVSMQDRSEFGFLHDFIDDINSIITGTVMALMIRQSNRLSYNARTQIPLSYKLGANFNKKGVIRMGNLKEYTKNELFRPVYGIRRTLINFEETIISTILRQIKGKYGIEISVTQPSEIDILTNWIKDRDPNFKHHITNPYALTDSRNNKYVLCGTFFIKVAISTYIFVDAEKWRDRSSRDSDEISPVYMYVFGKKAPQVFKKLSTFINTKNTSSNKIYSIVGVKDGERNYWNCTASKLTPRTMDTIFMNHNQKKRITDHIDQWVRSEKMYTDRGLLFKTGILLHGHAGTGKSSMAMAIANYLGCGLITIDPTTFQHMNIAEITESIVADETTYVILIDEIDTLFVSRDIQDASEIQKEKTAKLLSFLDSPQSPTNVVFVATTNYINRLDKALLRKGRFDIVEEMGDISRDIAIEMCKSFDLSSEESRNILNGVSTINPAQLQDNILTLIKEKEQKNANNELSKLAMDILERTEPNDPCENKDIK